MPELPEVETSRRGIEPHIVDTRVSRVMWPSALNDALLYWYTVDSWVGYVWSGVLSGLQK